MAPHVRDDRMRSWYAASMVTRYHTWSTHQTETNGQHSHGAAVIYARYFPPASAEEELNHGRVLHYILEHDLEELWTGDHPYPVKARYPGLKRALQEPEADAREAMDIRHGPFSVETLSRVKVCDLLQMCLYGQHEVHMGNRYAVPIMRDTMTAAAKLAAEIGDYAVNAVNQFAKDIDYD